MLNTIVIATENQKNTVEHIVRELNTQLSRVLVVYQAAINNLDVSSNVHVILSSHDFTGFSAGANRDIGIQYVEQHFPGINHYLFIDGDCIPSTDLLTHHYTVLNRNSAVITCGSRRNQMRNGDVVDDKRLASPLIRPRVFVPGIDRVVFDVRDIRAHNVVWSCNLGINASAINNIRKANACIASSNRVFSNVFDGQWGGEDTLLGLAGFHTSTPIVCLDPNKSWVMHQEHDIAYQGTSNLKKVFGYEAAMQACLDPIENIVVASHQIEDTPEFYSSIASANNSDWMSRICAYHNLSEQEARCVAYMFGANPTIQVDAKTTGHEFTQAQLSKLYHRLRTTPVGYQHVMA